MSLFDAVVVAIVFVNSCVRVSPHVAMCVRCVRVLVVAPVVAPVVGYYNIRSGLPISVCHKFVQINGSAFGPLVVDNIILASLSSALSRLSYSAQDCVLLVVRYLLLPARPLCTADADFLVLMHS